MTKDSYDGLVALEYFSTDAERNFASSRMVMILPVNEAIGGFLEKRSNRPGILRKMTALCDREGGILGYLDAVLSCDVDGLC